MGLQCGIPPLQIEQSTAQLTLVLTMMQRQIVLTALLNLATVAQSWVMTSTRSISQQQPWLCPKSPSASFISTRLGYASDPADMLSSPFFSELTGELLGEKYLLCKDSIGESTSAKSHLYKAYRRDESSGLPCGDQVVIKVSDNYDALRRETLNYNMLAYTQRFVDIKEFIEPAATCYEGECKCLILKDDKGALIMECGKQDLKSYIQVKGGLTGHELQTTARAAVECLQAMHERNLVWTELKSENFIVTQNGKVKGIDVESAVPIKHNPIDFTPKQCPPEFAAGYLCGREPFMEMDFSFDIWSTGMLLYELATGRHYFAAQEHCHVTVCMELKNTCGMDLSEVRQPLLQDLIRRCLHLDPSQRPTIQDVLQHPYFSSSADPSFPYAH